MRGAYVTLALLAGTVATASAQSDPAQRLRPTPSTVPVFQADAAWETPQTGLFQRKTGGTRRQPQTNGLSRGQSLFITANVLGGYDDNAGATVGSGTGSVPTTATSGSTGFADAMVEYSRGNSDRRVTFRSLGSLQMYPDYLDEPAPAAKGRMTGYTQVGESNTLRFSAQVRYEPLFTAVVSDDNALDDPAQGTALGGGAGELSSLAGGAAQAASLFERRSLVSSNKAYLERRWSQRDKTVFSYLYYGQSIVAGSAGNNRYQQAAGEYTRVVGRRAAWHASYQYTSGRQTDAADVTRPNKQHTMSVGPEFEKALSRTRRFAVRLGLGAAYVEKENSATGAPVEGWMPTASGSASIDLTRTWSLNGGYGRGFSMLQGLTGDFYSTDRAGISTHGSLTSRTILTVGGIFTNGRTVLGSGAGDTFNVYTGTAAMQVAVTSNLAATVSYFYYHQRFSNPAALPTGFPADYDRSAFTVGLTFWASLAGTSPARARGAGEW